MATQTVLNPASTSALPIRADATEVKKWRPLLIVLAIIGLISLIMAGIVAPATSTFIPHPWFYVMIATGCALVIISVIAGIAVMKMQNKNIPESPDVTEQPDMNPNSQTSDTAVAAVSQVKPTYRIYAKNRSAEEKMAKQLWFAVQEGKKETKTFPDQNWKKPRTDFFPSREDEKTTSHSGHNWGSVRVPTLRYDGNGCGASFKKLEDALVIYQPKLADGTLMEFFGVFDGHGDQGVVSNGAVKYFCKELVKRLNALN